MKKFLFLLVSLLYTTIIQAQIIIPQSMHVTKLNFWDLLILGLIQFIVVSLIQNVIFVNDKSKKHKIPKIYILVNIALIATFSVAMFTLNLLLSYSAGILAVIWLSMSLVLCFDPKNNLQSDRIAFISIDCILLLMASVSILESHFQLLIANVAGIVLGLFSYYLWRWLKIKII